MLKGKTGIVRYLHRTCFSSFGRYHDHPIGGPKISRAITRVVVLAQIVRETGCPDAVQTVTDRFVSCQAGLRDGRAFRRNTRSVGQRDFGENRSQEALGKWPPLLSRHPGLRLHGIGRLQSNKAADAVKLFDTIHSVDRRSLLDALVSQAEKSGRRPPIYIQVNIGEEEQKGGCAIGEIGELVETVRGSPLPGCHRARA